jgi:hypothetical protein
VLVRIPTVARYLGERDGDIRAEPVPGVSDAEVESFASRAVRPLCWLLAGQFCVSGSAVVVAGELIVVTGPPSAGKSALAAALARRGHRAVGDSMIRLDDSGDGRLRLGDGGANLDLWPDVEDALGIPRGRRLRAGIDKRSHDLAPGRGETVRRVLCLSPDARLDRAGRLVACSPLPLAEAVNALAGHHPYRRLVGPLRLGSRHAEWVAAACRSELLSLRRAEGPLDATLAALCEAVESTVG